METRVQAARHGPGRLDPLQPEPDREGRHHSEQDDRRREQDQNAEERPDRGACRDLVQPLDREVEERPGDERRQGDKDGRGCDDAAEDAGIGSPVGEPAAQPVPQRERRQDEPDHVRPHDRGVAEVRRQQPRRRDLGRERPDPGHEHERGQSAERHGGSSGFQATT